MRQAHEGLRLPRSQRRDLGHQPGYRDPSEPAVAVIPFQYGVPEAGRVFRASAECVRIGLNRGRSV